MCALRWGVILSGMKNLELKVPPPVVALVTAMGMWGLARAFPSPWGYPPLPVPWALALVALGVAIAVAGFAGFRRKGTTVDPTQPGKASALVTGGIYRFTRNPMYLGLTLGLLAWALRLGTALALLGPALFVPYITRFQVFPEERALRALFGAAYAQYTARVRRWL